jgi:hypothetical protein
MHESCVESKNDREIKGERHFHDILFTCIHSSLGSLASAVAVERVFSGGHDTISLFHASLKAETIRTLMLVKKKLHLDHKHANKALKSQISVVPIP